MLMISYRSNGSYGRCRRGCCGDDQSWDSDLRVNVPHSFEDALKIAVAIETDADENRHAQFDHYLLRTPTAKETEARTAGEAFDDWGSYIEGDLVKTELQGQRLSDLVEAVFKKRDEEKLALTAARMKEALESQAKTREVAERAQLAALKAKYEGGAK